MVLITSLASISPAIAQGKYKWWATNATSGWFENGIMCYPIKGNTGVAAGDKFTFSYRLGQSKKFVNLGSGVSIPGTTLVDDSGYVVVDPEAVDEYGEIIDSSPACDDPGSIAYISPHTVDQGGAYVLRLTVTQKNKGGTWSDDSNVLAAYSGVESGSSFFTNPPSVYFNEFTNANIGAIPGRGRIKTYTSKGSPRNACLILYDIAIAGGKRDGSISSAQLIASAQSGSYGYDVRTLVGNLAIPTAIKCAPWIATYLW
jgi:hypothetical protein